ncbi:MAG: NapC/NirT family cytochrome c [Dechloromonas sp.]|jgi:cytochrome c-type protein NapC|uniref:Cytochrome c-type protein n=1 Tax=Azonexus hydrophilus TaxID=418702 RepID=A0ABZ2XFH3_9RHOO|nr:NapC/NirT family cytochrome c [Azonexus hydrophilus]MBS4016994.1 NapC/NirT family cytochrome c [Dechloromonas sp.]MCA1938764.1 NapC/NirT family cytochrome c [Dechloromonas sp.]
MENNKPAGLIGRVRGWVAGIGVVTVLGLFGAGIIFWGGFNTAMEYTNTEKFCISCHEMKDNVYAEYQNTIHYSNRSGVRAVCSDCHVPKEWVPKMIRKIQASKEVWGKITGVVDTPEKFEAHRLTMATREWERMKANNSQECRNCHNFEYFDYGVQGRRGANTHQQAFNEGKTCIDCHKGIAHKLPEVDQAITVINADGAPPQVFHPPVSGSKD